VNGYSPALSLITAAAEILLAVVALRSDGRRRVLRPVAALLFMLAGYQLIEALVCTRPEDLLFARLAFCDVVWLPPLGQWVVLSCGPPAPRWVRRIVGGFFAGGAVLCVWVLADQSFVVGTVCSTVFATYEHGTPFHHVYGAYYHVGLGGMIVGAAYAMVHSTDAGDRLNLADLQIGTLGFMVPALVTQLTWKAMDPSLPSIMCHYAVVLAAFMVRIILRERRRAAGGDGSP